MAAIRVRIDARSAGGAKDRLVRGRVVEVEQGVIFPRTLPGGVGGPGGGGWEWVGVFSGHVYVQVDGVHELLIAVCAARVAHEQMELAEDGVVEKPSAEVAPPVRMGFLVMHVECWLIAIAFVVADFAEKVLLSFVRIELLLRCKCELAHA